MLGSGVQLPARAGMAEMLGCPFGKRSVDTTNTDLLVFPSLDILITTKTQQNFCFCPLLNPLSRNALERLLCGLHVFALSLFCLHIYNANQRMVRIYEYYESETRKSSLIRMYSLIRTHSNIRKHITR